MSDRPTLEKIGKRVVNAQADVPDFRDFSYRPTLKPLANRIDPPPPKERTILDQGQEGACTGFGLAGVINHLLRERGTQRTVSARMLYEMARKFDEWKGENYSGSSCRGAIRGWYNMGVCSDALAPFKPGQEHWVLTLDRARDARKTAPGAYYRIEKRLSDYHAALNEVDAIYVSAKVHAGWAPDRIGKDHVIPFVPGPTGGHAFAIVGYNEQGFWVQNSWGVKWGDHGVALWTYEDWLQNVSDAWVVRLAVETPQIWNLVPEAPAAGQAGVEVLKPSPRRSELVGHFVHIDDGQLDDRGKYWMDLATVEETARHVAMSPNYDHLLLYAHGGLNTIEDSARRIVAMKEVFKANRIYPFHFMYDTGLIEEVKDLVLGKKEVAEGRAGGVADFMDQLIERATHRAGRAIWREMKSDAVEPFRADRAGRQTIDAFLNAFAAEGATPKKIHLVGHSTGGILLASLLDALKDLPDPPQIASCSLMAPACTVGTFSSSYRPLLPGGRGTGLLGKMVMYILSDELELDDTVTPLYRKSLLYLVSNAFEEEPHAPILGMQKFRRRIGRIPRSLRIETSEGITTGSPRTASTTHGGFDNDPFTLNDILRTVLGVARNRIPRLFTTKDLEY